MQVILKSLLSYINKEQIDAGKNEDEIDQMYEQLEELTEWSEQIDLACGKILSFYVSVTLHAIIILNIRTLIYTVHSLRVVCQISTRLEDSCCCRLCRIAATRV